MTWPRIGDKQLSQSMMAKFLNTHTHLLATVNENNDHAYIEHCSILHIFCLNPCTSIIQRHNKLQLITNSANCAAPDTTSAVMGQRKTITFASRLLQIGCLHVFQRKQAEVPRRARIYTYCDAIVGWPWQSQLLFQFGGTTLYKQHCNI